MTAIFEKVELASQNDLAAVRALLDAKVAEYLQDKGAAAPEAVREALVAVSANAMSQIARFVACGDPADGDATPSAALRSPLLAPLSPPPADDEVAALEAEVEAASRRVAALRAAAPAQVQGALAARLAAARPTADVSPAADADDAAAAALEAPPSPRAESLQAALADAVARVPGVLARLAEAQARQDRVRAAIAGDLARPPPGPVERAVLGRAPGGCDPPAVERALATGAVSTRRGRSEGRALAPLEGEAAEEGEEEGAPSLAPTQAQDGGGEEEAA